MLTCPLKCHILKSERAAEGRPDITQRGTKMIYIQNLTSVQIEKIKSGEVVSGAWDFVGYRHKKIVFTFDGVGCVWVQNLRDKWLCIKECEWSHIRALFKKV